MLWAWVKLMRPGDWVKNVFIFPALVFSERIGDPYAVADTLATFAGFCLLASGFYCVNDALDYEKDRTHPVKRHRPVAAGLIQPRSAFIFGVLLIAAGLVAGFLIQSLVGAIFACYLIIQVAYNLRLKRVIFVDVVALAIGFGLRAASGAAAINIGISIWLLLCVFFLCLYLGFIKRLCDLASAEKAGDSMWRSPAGYHDRSELNWLLGMSAVLAVMTYLMYSISEHAIEIFGARAFGFALLSPLVLIAVHRFYRRASHAHSDSPLAALLQDRAVLLSVVLFTIGVLACLYVPQVEDMLEGLFLLDGIQVDENPG